MLGHRMRMPSGSRGLTIAASASGTSFTMESLFTPTQWTSTTAKKVTVPAGVQLGSSNSSAALTIGSTAWGGDLTLEVSGTISGSGGTAGTAGAGGVGGNAVDANRLGSTSQKLIVNILSGGIIRGGGGGGGKGGVGGSGQYYVSEGPYGSNTAPAYHWSVAMDEANFNGIYWNNTLIYNNNGYVTGSWWSATSKTVGSWTYTKGSLFYTVGNVNRYNVSRTATTVTATSGGAGGSGGRGQGYDGSSASGSAGSAGGTSAGTGGTGGAGALYGATGTTGSTGASGNAGAGVAGSSGGLAGYYIANAANAIITNSGTVQGR